MILGRINEEEAELLADLDINWEEELDDYDKEEGHSYFDEMESNKVSLTPYNERVDSDWEQETTSSEEEENNDPTPSMKAYTLKHWYHQGTFDNDQSTDLDQAEDWKPRIQSTYPEYSGYFSSSDQEENCNPQVVPRQ
jgi:hypothetical protein